MTWWMWIAIGFGVGLFEILLPAFLFLGFAIGFALTGLVALVSGDKSWVLESPWNGFLLGSILALVAWIVLRQLVGVRDGQSRLVSRDINEIVVGRYGSDDEK